MTWPVDRPAWVHARLMALRGKPGRCWWCGWHIARQGHAQDCQRETTAAQQVSTAGTGMMLGEQDGPTEASTSTGPDRNPTCRTRKDIG